MSPHCSLILAVLFTSACCKLPGQSGETTTAGSSPASTTTPVAAESGSVATGATSPVASDADIEGTIRKVYEAIPKGDHGTVLRGCHPEIGKYKGSFDTGYSPGRSGSLGELPNWAMSVKDGDQFRITNLRIEVVRKEGDRAIAWAKYHAFESHKGTLDSNKGQTVTDEWDAQDYLILKKYNGAWRLRRMEDRAGHALDLKSQNSTGDPWGGVK